MPTFVEAGLPLPEINAGGWLGILAPAATPQAIVGKLNEAFNAALRDEAIRRELKGLGFIPRVMTPREFSAFLHEDMAKWPPIIAAAVLMGVVPNLFLRPIEPAVERMLTQVHRGSAVQVRIVQPGRAGGLP